MQGQAAHPGSYNRDFGSSTVSVKISKAIEKSEKTVEN